MILPSAFKTTMERLGRSLGWLAFAALAVALPLVAARAGGRMPTTPHGEHSRGGLAYLGTASQVLTSSATATSSGPFIGTFR